MKKKERRPIQIGVRLTREMHQRLREIAAADERAVSSLVYKIVKEYLGKDSMDAGDRRPPA
jgi:predicted DNA-binding protein